jgi:hypothetical protein
MDKSWNCAHLDSTCSCWTGSPRMGSTFLHAWTALGSTWQHGQQQHSAATAAPSSLGQQHLQHLDTPGSFLHASQHLDQLLDSTTPNACSTSTPNSNLQHSAAPAAPMDSSSCTSSNSQRPAPNCPRQGQHTQQTHTRTSRFFLFLVSC